MRIAVISPHRGDAAFALSLTVGQWLRDGHDVDVLNCFTRSRLAPLLDDAFLHANDVASYITALRAREDEAWRRSYRIPRTQALVLQDVGLKDADIRLRCSEEEACTMAEPADEKARAKIRKAVAAAKADALALPLAWSGHVDARVAWSAAMETFGAERPCAFYEEMPWTLRAADAEEIRARVHEVAADAEAFYASEPTRDVEAAVKRKRAQVLCFDSQISEAEGAEIAAYAARFGGRERMWGNAAWRATVLAGFVE